MSSDFGDLAGPAGRLAPNQPASEKRGYKRKGMVADEDEGAAREYLKVFETLPATLLNVYGEAKYVKLADAEVWKNLCQPMKSGAKYMTELCSSDEERRGVGLNRWLHALLVFCKYQNTDVVKKQNKFLLQAKLTDELYTEIDKILPALEYCLAPKKQTMKSGSVALRCGAAPAPSDGPARVAGMLDKNAKILYEWLAIDAPSRIRMLFTWQSAGGLSHVAAAYHRATQCFRYEGNALHLGPGSQVSLEDFQVAIKSRHTSGMAQDREAGAAELQTQADFELAPES